MQRKVENVNNVAFTVETLLTKNGEHLGSMTPDDDGYYNDFPLAVLGSSTQNNTYYHVEPFVKQITDEDSYVNKMLANGTLYGEYGHPALEGLDKMAQLNRLATVAEDRRSHHFKRIRTGKTLENGCVLIVGDIKPTGDYGPRLEENLREKFMNTCFSLRSITKQQQKDGLLMREMLKLITFDMVTAGGYYEASKRFADNNNTAGNESLSYTFIPDSDMVLSEQISVENFSNSELNDIFGTNDVLINRKTFTMQHKSDLAVLKGSNNITSIQHELLRG